MITIVDCGLGNLNSIANMLKRCGHRATVSANPDEIRAATMLILPGVGAFDTGMQRLTESGIAEALSDRVLENRTPVLGICLGMQMMFEGSEEGELGGLGWLPGRCVRFRFDSDRRDLKIPHMGWNRVEPTRTDGLFKDADDDTSYYFVHSYHVVCATPSDVLGETTHGYTFTSAVQRGHIFGTQFHPEKSHRHGMRLLKAFAEL